jgi:uncharacterized membrane protein
MVLTSLSPDGSAVIIMARGNFSLGAGGLINLLLALTVVTLGLAGLLAWQGFWPVLLIAVIQLVLVIWILIRAWKRAWVSEVIIAGPEWVEVIWQRHNRVVRTEGCPAIAPQVDRAGAVPDDRREKAAG